MRAVSVLLLVAAALLLADQAVPAAAVAGTYTQYSFSDPITIPVSIVAAAADRLASALSIRVLTALCPRLMCCCVQSGTKEFDFGISDDGTTPLYPAVTFTNTGGPTTAYVGNQQNVDNLGQGMLVGFSVFNIFNGGGLRVPDATNIHVGFGNTVVSVTVQIQIQLTQDQMDAGSALCVFYIKDANPTWTLVHVAPDANDILTIGSSDFSDSGSIVSALHALRVAHCPCVPCRACSYVPPLLLPSRSVSPALRLTTTNRMAATHSPWM